jgi:tetratricopeptide (TPR) repeat protein
VVGVVFASVLSFEFVWDDGWTLLGNGFLRHPEDLPLLLGREASLRHVPDAFRPVSVTFDVAVYALVGLSRPAQHAVNLALHLGCCALTWRVLDRLDVEAVPRAAATTLFGVLAVHAEPVAVVSYREDLLAAAFALAALGLALDVGHARRRAGPGLAVLVILAALASAAKVSATPLPLVAWIHLRWPLRGPSGERPDVSRARLRHAVVLALALGVAAALAHQRFVVGSVVPWAADRPGILHGSGAEQIQLFARVLARMLVPIGLSPEYAELPARWSDPGTWACALGLAGAGAFTFVGRTRRPAAWVVAATVLLWWLPVSDIVPLPNFEADRYAYLPALPVCLGLGLAAHAAGSWLAARFATAPLALAPALVLVVVQGSAAGAAAHVYRTEAALWEVALQRAPGSGRALAMAGLLRIPELLRSTESTSHPDPALLARVQSACLRAIQAAPDEELPHLCAARLALAVDEPDEAFGHLRRAYAAGIGRRDRILAMLAEVGAGLGDPADDPRAREALELLGAGLKAYPYSADLALAAARVAHRAGRAEAAAAGYARARSLRPERWETVAWQAELALDLGDAAAAAGILAQAERLLREADPSIMAALRRRLSLAGQLGGAPTPHTSGATLP